MVGTIKQQSSPNSSTNMNSANASLISAAAAAAVAAGAAGFVDKSSTANNRYLRQRPSSICTNDSNGKPKMNGVHQSSHYYNGTQFMKPPGTSSTEYTPKSVEEYCNYDDELDEIDDSIVEDNYDYDGCYDTGIADNHTSQQQQHTQNHAYGGNGVYGGSSTSSLSYSTSAGSIEYRADGLPHNHTLTFFEEVVQKGANNEIKTFLQCLECKKKGLFKVFSKNTGKTNLDMHLNNCHQIVTVKRKRGVFKYRNGAPGVSLTPGGLNGSPSLHHTSLGADQTGIYEDSSEGLDNVARQNRPPGGFKSTMDELDQKVLFLSLDLHFKTSSDHSSSSFLVEMDHFQQFVALLNPDYQIPTRSRLLQLVDTYYSEYVEYIKLKLSEVRSVSLSIDKWSSNRVTTQSTASGYFSVNCHFIDELTFRSCCLGIRNSELELFELLSSFGITDKTLFAIAANDNASIEQLKPKVRNCYVGLDRLLQNTLDGILRRIDLGEAGNEDLKRLREAVGKSRDIVSLITDSTPAQIKCQKWHQTYLMLKQTVESYETIATNNQTDKPDMLLDDIELESIRCLLKLLEPFNKIVELINSNTANKSLFASASIVLPSLKYLEKFLTDKQGDNKLTQTLKQTFREPLLGYMHEFHSNQEASDKNLFLLTAAFLNPYYKDLKFVDKANRKCCMKRITKYILDQIVRSSQEQEDDSQQEDKKSGLVPPPAKMARMSTSDTKKLVFDDSDEESDSDVEEKTVDGLKRHELKAEIRKYIADDSSPADDDYENAEQAGQYDDALAFWHSKRDKYPMLAELSSTLLSMPATCLPSSRLCSTGIESHLDLASKIYLKQDVSEYTEKMLFILENNQTNLN